MAQFGPLEAAIMDVLWSRAEPHRFLTVREVLTELNRTRPLAYTTVLTVLDNLHRKGWVQRELEGRAWRYTATTSREDHIASLMSEMLSGADDPHAVVLRLVAQLPPEEAAQIRSTLLNDPPPPR